MYTHGGRGEVIKQMYQYIKLIDFRVKSIGDLCIILATFM